MLAIVMECHHQEDLRTAAPPRRRVSRRYGDTASLLISAVNRMRGIGCSHQEARCLEERLSSNRRAQRPVKAKYSRIVSTHPCVDKRDNQPEDSR